MGVQTGKEWTLSEAARLLEEPQHRLIYLCEKEVVVPDFSQARGRGSSRRFSARNILEFAVALRLRKLMIPAASVAAIIHVLRSFEKAVLKEPGRSSLPESLLDSKAPDLSIVINDAQVLYFALQSGNSASRYFGGLDLGALDLSRNELSSKLAGEIHFDERGSGKITLSVTKVARELALKDKA